MAFISGGDANFLPASCRQRQAGSPRSPDSTDDTVVDSLFLSLRVPVLNHLDALQRHHSAAHHFFQYGEETADLLFAIDDFNDDWQIHREPQNFCGVHAARFPKTHWSTQKGPAAQSNLAC